MRALRHLRAAAAVCLLLATAPPAFADHDATPDADDSRCDTWYRDGHDPDGDASSHEHTEESLDRDVGGVVYLHDHTGHYVVRGPVYYLEIVGGGYYDGEGSDNMHQGGYVQGEVDPGPPIPADGDFHFNFFASGKSGLCVSVADTKVGDEGTDPQHP